MVEEERKLEPWEVALEWEREELRWVPDPPVPNYHMAPDRGHALRRISRARAWREID